MRIKITGKVDGLDEQGRVVETKHRRRRLFNKIPLYERVQLEVYMWLTNTRECVHIENFGSSSNNLIYRHDDELWSDILQGLHRFEELVQGKTK